MSDAEREPCRSVPDGRPLIGANYHPSSAGCGFWRSWPAAEIRADLAVMAHNRLNAVRFFIYWADFEPEPGVYDEVVFSRLVELVDMVEDAGMRCVPSVLTVWMNGERFDPPWRAGRSLIDDPEMAERSARFAAEVARRLAGRRAVHAYDIGDELRHATGGDGERVVEWVRLVAGAIRRADPDALVLQANDVTTLDGPRGFGPPDVDHLDLIGLHGFPTWTPFQIESNASYKAVQLPAFLAALGSAFGPTIIDEFGCYGASEEITTGYIAAAGRLAYLHGARGCFLWTWRDIATTERPFDAAPIERTQGILDSGGVAKPRLAAARQLARTVHITHRRGMRRPDARAAIYLPVSFRRRLAAYLGNGNPSPLVSTFYAFLLARRAHIDVVIRAGDVSGFDLVICPSVERITELDLTLLRDAAARGATVYYSVGDHLHGFPGPDLAGSSVEDFSATDAGTDRFRWRSVEYPLAWGPGESAPVVDPGHATEVGLFADGSPAMTINEIGLGRVCVLNVPFERQLNVRGRLDEFPWERLYEDLAALARVPVVGSGLGPTVETWELTDGDRRQLVAINLSATEVVASLAWPTEQDRRPISLGPDEITIIAECVGDGTRERVEP